MNNSNGNIIRKHTKDKNFTIIDNNIFMDKNLSLKGKGLLTMLLSLPDNWSFSERGLTALSKDGRDSLRSGLDELEELGYLERYIGRNDNGQFANTVYNVYEIPQSGKPKSDNPTLDNPTVYKELNNKELNNKELNNTLVQNDDMFNEFWKEYPKKTDKKRSRRLYKKIDEETHSKILNDLEKRKRTDDWLKENGKFIPMPSTYLNNERWSDELDGIQEDEFRRVQTI